MYNSMIMLSQTIFFYNDLISRFARARARIDQNIIDTIREFSKKEKIDIGKMIKDTLIFFERIEVFTRDQISIFIKNV